MTIYCKCVENRERNGTVVVPAFFPSERSPPLTCEEGGGAKLREPAGANAGVKTVCEIRTVDFFNTEKKQRAILGVGCLSCFRGAKAGTLGDWTKTDESRIPFFGP